MDLISDMLFLNFVGIIFVMTLIKAGEIHMETDRLFSPLEYIMLLLLWPLVFAITVKVIVQGYLFDE